MAGEVANHFAVVVEVFAPDEARKPASVSPAAEAHQLPIPLSNAATQCQKIRQLTVAPLIAETIQRIAKGESVMSLFSDQENLF